jgi:hypothetical protein
MSVARPVLVLREFRGLRGFPGQATGDAISYIYRVRHDEDLQLRRDAVLVG